MFVLQSTSDYIFNTLIQNDDRAYVAVSTKCLLLAFVQSSLVSILLIFESQPN